MKEIGEQLQMIQFGFSYENAFFRNEMNEKHMVYVSN